MKLFAVCLLLVASTMLGCAQNHFNIPAENFAEKVKVLGVAPILIDADSDIIYPQKDLLLQIITDLNRKHEPLLARKLQNTGSFYAVTPLTDEPRQLFSSLMARREKRDDAGIQYNKYFWKNDEINAYIRKNRLDAVMVIVVSGLTKNSRIYATNLMTSLETNFNFMTMTAQILGPDGTVLWEYPNFRGRFLTYYPLVNLQYPDFSESEANLSRKIELRFKTLDGIRRTLEEKKSDWLLRDTPEPGVYGRLFDEMASFFAQVGDKQVKGAGAVDGKQQQPAEGKQNPGKKSADTAPERAPSSKSPEQAPLPKKPVATTDVPTSSTNEIVPATESTR